MNHFQRYLTDEFAEDYQEGRLSRRDALKLIASVTGSLIVANSILAACAPPPDVTQTASAAEDFSTTIPAPGQPSGTDSQTSTPSAYGTVMSDDPAVIGSEIEIPTDIPPLMGYLARPSNGQSPKGDAVVLVCHENRGLTPHIQDVTRRFAKAGYVSLAVALVFRQGGSAAVDEGSMPEILGSILQLNAIQQLFQSQHLILG